VEGSKHDLISGSLERCLEELKKTKALAGESVSGPRYEPAPPGYGSEPCCSVETGSLPYEVPNLHYELYVF
jgi:hypothetical protein